MFSTMFTVYTQKFRLYVVSGFNTEAISDRDSAIWLTIYVCTMGVGTFRKTFFSNK